MKLGIALWLAGRATAGILRPVDLTSTADDTPLPTSTSVTSQPVAVFNTSINNANHIFNAVRGAMRQWDGAWNHNGMSFFLAEVPEGVQLYHGTHREEGIKGMEWLAFEPEHAIGFARGRGGPPPGGPGHHGPPPPSHVFGEDDVEGNDSESHVSDYSEAPQDSYSAEGHRGKDGKYRGSPPPPGPPGRHGGDQKHRGPPPPPHSPPEDHDGGRKHRGPPPFRPGPPGHHDKDDEHRRPPPPPGFPGHHDEDRKHRSPPPPPHGPPGNHDGDHDHPGPPPAPAPPGHHDKDHDHWGPPPPPDRDHRGPLPPPPPPGPPKHHGPGPHPPPPSPSGPPCDHHRNESAPHGPPGGHRRKGYPPPSKPHFGQSLSQNVISAPHNQPPPPEDGESTGFLHFYRTLHTLRLLYIDGMSAGKTSKGTLDSQDYVLRQGSERGDPQPFDDPERAQALCNVSRDSWENKIDGFVRLEAGFEIILCDFEKHLHLERAQAVENDNSGGRGRSDSGFRFYRAISDRFQGIGGNRVRVDYANMITAFNSELDLWTDDPAVSGEVLPRLQNISTDDLKILQAEVTSMVMNPAEGSAVDWQSVAELFVQRYAVPLQYLVTPDLDDADFEHELEMLLRPFTSDSPEDIELVTTRCIEQFLPPSSNTSLAGLAVSQIGYKICSTLVNTLDTVQTLSYSTSDDSDTETIFAAARAGIKNLIAYLDWPIWRECHPGCAYDEVCVLPIWPLTGSIEDRKQPSCKNATTLAGEKSGPGPNGGDYWRGQAERPGAPGPLGKRHGKKGKDGKHHEQSEGAPARFGELA